MNWTDVDATRVDEGTLALPLSVATTLYGGSATVKKYWEPSLQRHVVGKRVVITAKKSMADALREPQWQHRLQHAHLVPVITVSDVLDTSETPAVRVDDEVAIITPYYERGSVFDALWRGEQFDIAEAIAIARAAALGLAELHRENILHRDFKSPNVFLSDDGSIARVGDLGEAHTMDAAGLAPGLESPTPWIAPEQIARDEASVASDLFGLGVMLLELMLGGLDLRGYDRAAAYNRMRRGHTPLPRREMKPPPWTPPRVRTVIRQLTHADPAQRRPASATSVADALAKAPVIGWTQVSAGERWEGCGRADKREYAVNVRQLPRAGAWEVRIERRGQAGWRALRTQRHAALTDEVLSEAFDAAVATSVSR